MANPSNRITLYWDKRKLRGKDDREAGKKSWQLLGGRLEAGELPSLAGFWVIGAKGFFQVIECTPGCALGLGVLALRLQRSCQGDVGIAEFVGEGSSRNLGQQQ